MRTLFILLLSAAFSLHGTAQQKETPVNSRITQVTVFFNGAEVTRKASVPLQAGTQVLKLDKLSSHIDPQSIQIEGQSNYSIVSVTHRANFLTDADQSDEVKSLKAKIRKLKEELGKYHVESTVLEQEKAFITTNNSFTSVATARNATADDFMDVSELYQKRYRDASLKLLNVQQKKAEIIQELDKLDKQLKTEIHRTLNQHTSEILVHLSAPVKTNAEIVVRYFTGMANWTPAYDARVSDIKSPLELYAKALVKQATGEDWQNVKLRLSTGNPSVSNTLPALDAWELSGYDNSEKKNKSARYERSVGEGYAAGKPAPSIAPVREEVEMDGVASFKSPVSAAEFTTVNTMQVNTEYDIALPYTILSDGKEYHVEIQQHTLPAEYRYYAAPKYDRSAFLLGRITGWEKLHLIPGMAQVYFQDTYTGRSYFDTRTTEDTLDISLGRDRAVVIERRKSKDYAQQAIIGSSKKVTLGIEITLRNTKATTVMLDLEDQIPVSKQKEIEVALIDNGGAVYKKEDGSLRWKLILGPGESKKLKFAYSVKFPKDKEISNF